LQRTGTATLQWLVGRFCAGIGTLLLVEPHQFVDIGSRHPLPSC